MSGLEYTQRGFGIYGRFTDYHNNEVRIQQSSANMATAWIFTKPMDQTVIINVEQAQSLIEALQVFIKEATSE